jgi:hypothetical protein
MRLPPIRERPRLTVRKWRSAGLRELGPNGVPAAVTGTRGRSRRARGGMDPDRDAIRHGLRDHPRLADICWSEGQGSRGRAFGAGGLPGPPSPLGREPRTGHGRDKTQARMGRTAWRKTGKWPFSPPRGSRHPGPNVIVRNKPASFPAAPDERRRRATWRCGTWRCRTWRCGTYWGGGRAAPLRRPVA